MKIQNSNINFKAGLTAAMQREIKACNVAKISSHFAQNGINTDFKNNKLIAWCSLKCLEIIEALNKKYNLKLGLPEGIIVEDFSKLKLREKGSLGFVNIASAKLYIEKEETTPGRTIFFNEFKKFNYPKGNEFWDRIDKTSDDNFERHLSATDFFLEVFLHEFMHIAHESHLIKKLGADKFLNLADKVLEAPNIQRFQDKYEHLTDKICSYASSNPMETVACDLSNRIIKNLDENTLIPKDNFIPKSPYETRAFLYNMFHKRNPDILFNLLKNLWNGKFDFIH